jgi:recombination protein RecA
VSKKEKENKAVDDFTSQLIKDINKEMGLRVAYNLSEAEAPTIVKRWLDTGSVQLNYAIRNAAGGGYPEGRVIEISGLPSSGKSHLAYNAASYVQSLGGLVVYIDTENATPVDKLAKMGVDVSKRFVYVDTHCTEEVFHIMESTIEKAKQIIDKNVPILVIWDSVAATSPKAELEGEYDKDTMGLQARVIAKCMRKISGVLAKNNITLICINQLKTSIGVMHGDPNFVPGGRAIPFHASVRIRLGSGSPVKDKAGNEIGIKVTVNIKKNKVAPPFQKFEFKILFGVGIDENEELFDVLRAYCDKNSVVHNNQKLSISGDGGWKKLEVVNVQTGEEILSKSFRKDEFDQIRKDPLYKTYIEKIIDTALTKQFGSPASDDEESESDDQDEVVSE